MAGETDLNLLLAGMEPELAPAPYGYVTLPPGRLPPEGLAAFATVAEAEGLTLVAPVAELERLGLAAGARWARISLTIHSDLSAVGLTAAFSAALTGAGISANVIAGFYHDHLFVQWDRRDEAMTALRSLAAGASDA